MTQCTANFELGTNASAVLAADAGSATAWNTVTDVGPKITYSTAHPASGTLCAQIALTAGGAHMMIWGAAFGTLTDHYGRVYVYLTANPANATPFINVNSGGSRAARFDINTNGTIRAFDNPGSALFTTTTNAIALNQLVRIEWHIVHSATVGQGELKLFNTASSSTATETSTGTANKNTLANGDEIQFGNINGDTPYTFWMDQIVAGASSYPGPYVAQTNYEPGFGFKF